MKRGCNISDLLRPLSEKPNQVYLSNQLQVADVLDWILAQTGTAEIWQTSFSISEEFLRRMFFISQARKVSAINLVLDFKATQKTLKLWTFIRNVTKHTYLADNHSKILLVRGGNSKVSVVTSQNLTRGNRHESAFISSDPELFDTLFSQVNDLITNKSVCLDDLLGRNIKED